MNVERTASLTARVARHAALADPVRLTVVDLLAHGDLSPSELQRRLGLGSNLLAHHLRTLEDAGIATRRRSEGDRRRSYVTLVAPGPDAPVAASAGHPLAGARRVVFACTANSARSQLAAALWQRTSPVPAASAGTHPVDRIAPGARAAARRHRLSLGGRPQHLDDVLRDGDVVVTVCDRAHEELDGRDAVHWAVTDPVPAGTAAAFDAALADLDRRIGRVSALAESAGRGAP